MLQAVGYCRLLVFCFGNRNQIFAYIGVKDAILNTLFLSFCYPVLSEIIAMSDSQFL